MHYIANLMQKNYAPKKPLIVRLMQKSLRQNARDIKKTIQKNRLPTERNGSQIIQ